VTSVDDDVQHDLRIVFDPNDRADALRVLNKLRDGVVYPPGGHYLFTGRDEERRQLDLLLVSAGTGRRAACFVLEGAYGAGKSAFLHYARVQAELAQYRSYFVSLSQARGGASFTQPQPLLRTMLGTPLYWYSRVRAGSCDTCTFAAVIENVSMRARAEGLRGAAFFFDEVEAMGKLTSVRSRYKAYRFVDALFLGGCRGRDVVRGDCYARGMGATVLGVAMTPDAIDEMADDGEVWWRVDRPQKNPMLQWRNERPNSMVLEPLARGDAILLADKVLHLFGVAEGLDVTITEVEATVDEWMRLGVQRDERVLVRSLVRVLDRIADQQDDADL
jgi:hypothetical protein